MKKQQEDILRLRKRVNIKFGNEIKEHADFVSLHIEIIEKTQRSISISTLKRVFGYLKSKSFPSNYTLDTLCMYIGYKNWHKFVTVKNEGPREDSQNSIRALKNAFYTLEFDLQGFIISTNGRLRKLLNKKKNELIDYQLNEVSLFQHEAGLDFFIEDIKQGNIKKTITKISTPSKVFWMKKTFTPIKNRAGKVYKILMIGDEVMKDQITASLREGESINDIPEVELL